jgi:hypothetical protein
MAAHFWFIFVVELIMFFSVSVPNFIKIGQCMAVLQFFFAFQDGGSDHLGKWSHTFGFELFELCMIFLVSVSNFINVRR